MQEVQVNILVSVVVPCYNGASWLNETLLSILNQDETNLEIILVDDGSTDDTKKVVQSLNDKRIKYIYQNNSGVSSARNNGFKNIAGDFVIFFDADDKMDSGFIKSRLNVLTHHAIDFVGGDVQKFNEQGLITGYFRGVSENAPREVLFYDEEVTTCPSNYMLRSSFLQTNGILFNEKLSSTADRYFILECASKGKCTYSPEVGKLHYRVLANSMSHNLTKKLVFDNIEYYSQLINNKLIPQNILKKSLFVGYFILFASCWKTSLKRLALSYAVRAFVLSPIGFFKRMLK